MKRLMQGVRTWAWNFDLMTDAFYIEEDRTKEPTGADQQKVNGAIGEVGEALLILSAVMVIWLPILILLWP